MKKMLLLTGLMIVFILSGFSQEDDKMEKLDSDFDIMEDKFDDAFEEEENQQMTLRFINSVTGEPVEKAKIMVQDEELFTDYDGKVRFEIIEDDGNYPAKFSCKGYISATYEFEVRAGTIFRNRFSVSPILDIGSMRIVLDWDRRPGDLDAHFMNQGKYHISYRHKQSYDDGRVTLDRDDRNGFGPETITIRDVNENDNYAYFVHDYSNRNNDNNKQLAKSGAIVRVYQDNELIKTFKIKEGERGNLWKVFTLLKGKFVPINEVESR